VQAMPWISVDSQADLDGLEQSVCWIDSFTIEYYGTFRDAPYFPSDICRSGYDRKNIYVLHKCDSPLGVCLEMVFVHCDCVSGDFLDKPFVVGRVDTLKRVEIWNGRGAAVMRCARLIYRFLQSEPGRPYFARSDWS